MVLRRFLAAALLLSPLLLNAQPVDHSWYGELRYRHIGPFRGGRTVAAVGVPQRPYVFYIGVNNGGVWKTDDAGRTWNPIFDDQPTQSIGAIAVAPSNPDIIYVGSGEGLQRPDLSTGDGMYRSNDAGKSWTHLGLRDSQQIPMIVVDPHDPNRLFVAVLGHPYGPNSERGIYRSTDGGEHFERVFYKDENTGAMDVALDPANPLTVYAVLWAARYGPWENAYFTGTGTGLYKSTDGGASWSPLTKGLPGAAEGVGRIGVDVSASHPNRLYAIVAAKSRGGLYRSDDGGASWTLRNGDPRLWTRDGDFQEVRCDPKNDDIIYVANVVTWKSTDGGTTIQAFRGAPGGDDYHRVWIDPNDPRTILIASDQGAIVTLNGGSSWSSWYNQPTAQFYHVNTDNSFPYRVCGGQQESGSACVNSRSDDGRITFHDWHPVAAEEYGYAVPDPLNPDLIYGGKISRFDFRTGQASSVTPKALPDSSYRVVRTQPIAFSPVDPHVLLFASNTLWKTTTEGKSWTQISPDLSRKDWALPASVGIYATSPAAKVTQRGVIYAIAPSPLEVDRIWAGTDDGLIHVTVDGGKNWRNVTPTELKPWAKVSILEASHFDAREAWAAINTFHLDDLRPHILRTLDGGDTWSEIVKGIPDGGVVNVVREDPKTKGLLFAGTEQSVYVSFDDGAQWYPLRQNLPASSVRDLVLHGDDLVVATHGRGFWILDDIEPLRQIAAMKSAPAVMLFRPQTAMRFRWSKWSDTPMPPDEPYGENPPDGAIVDYYLGRASGIVTLEVSDSSGRVMRHYSSTEPIEPPRDEGNVPAYWIRPQRALSSAPGMHRFVWDLHLAPMPGARHSYPIGAVPHDTPPSDTSPWVLPGDYTVTLSVDGVVMKQALTVVMDPRVKSSPEELEQQWTLSRDAYEGIARGKTAIAAISAAILHEKAMRVRGRDAEHHADTWERNAAQLAGSGSDSDDEDAAPGAAAGESLSSVVEALTSLLADVQSADVAPTIQQTEAMTAKRSALDGLLKKWRALQVGR